MTWKLSIFAVIFSLALLQGVVYAETDDGVVVTARAGAVMAPFDFTATYVSETEVSLEWELPPQADKIMVRAKYGSPPTNINDGYLVYYGGGDSYTDDNVFFDEYLGTLYYSAYAEDSDVGWSPTPEADEVEGLGMLLFGLIAIAFGITFFAFKTAAVLFRISAATAWLTILLYILSEDKTLVITNPWVVSLFMALFCMVMAILLLYMGKTIDNAWLKDRTVDPRSREVQVKEDHRDMLRKRLSKVDKGGYGGRVNKRL